MKKWTAVEVVWIDAHGGDDGWVELGAEHMTPEQVRTVGMLVQENEEGVTLTLSRMASTQVVGGYVFIPWVNIIELYELVSYA